MVLASGIEGLEFQVWIQSLWALRLFPLVSIAGFLKLRFSKIAEKVSDS